MNPITRLFKRLISVCGIVLLSSWTILPAKGATNIVLSGENLQTRIDAAAAGDTLVIQSGAYGGAITINKALTLVRTGTTDAQLQGPVSINTAGAVAISQLQFADALTITGGALVSVQDSRIQGGVSATGGALNMKRSEVVGGMRLTNAAMTGLRLTNRIEVTAFAAPNSKLPLTCAQSTFEALLRTVGYSVSLGYSKLFSLSVTDGEATLVGNRVYYWDSGRTFNNDTIGIYRSSLNMYNNDVRAVIVTGGGALKGLYAMSCTAKVVNNIFDVNCVNSYQTIGIECDGPGSAMQILGNIFNPHGAVNANFTVVRRDGFGGVIECAYCCYPPGRPFIGVQFLSTLELEQPSFAPDGSLPVDSPCRNAGSPEAIYNDRDGSRNDIGYTGGPLFNSGNYTNDLPMAFWLNTTPRKFIKGQQSTIRVDAAAVAGH